MRAERSVKCNRDKSWKGNPPAEARASGLLAREAIDTRSHFLHRSRRTWRIQRGSMQRKLEASTVRRRQRDLCVLMWRMLHYSVCRHCPGGDRVTGQTSCTSYRKLEILQGSRGRWCHSSSCKESAVLRVKWSEGGIQLALCATGIPSQAWSEEPCQASGWHVLYLSNTWFLVLIKARGKLCAVFSCC